MNYFKTTFGIVFGALWAILACAVIAAAIFMSFVAYQQHQYEVQKEHEISMEYAHDKARTQQENFVSLIPWHPNEAKEVELVEQFNEYFKSGKSMNDLPPGLLKTAKEISANW